MVHESVIGKGQNAGLPFIQKLAEPASFPFLLICSTTVIATQAISPLTGSKESGLPKPYFFVLVLDQHKLATMNYLVLEIRIGS